MSYQEWLKGCEYLRSRWVVWVEWVVLGSMGKREHHLTAWQCGAQGSVNADYRTALLPILPITTQNYPFYPKSPPPRLSQERKLPQDYSQGSTTKFLVRVVQQWR